MTEVTRLWHSNYENQHSTDDEFKQFIKGHGYTMREFLVGWIKADYHRTYVGETEEFKNDRIEQWMGMYGEVE